MRIPARAVRPAILVGGLLVAAGPHGAAAGPGRPETIHVTFACPTGRTLAVTFVNGAGPEQAIVRPGDGGAVTLPVQLSGSGFRYTDATHELRGKGRSVTWTDGSGKPITCTDQTPAGSGPR
ncbi:MliC family protein [Methylobacterium fujisawaense]|uniref:MliC family protein n=1 Tax=Methylobacterium fujisawaense TaxID=107400 RepID=UPI002449811B|nr:MliC family protein [Methylobacterium fujisawaense]MDH3032579.1 MliC family protein [Methylobacterium fujisawaense]